MSNHRIHHPERHTVEACLLYLAILFVIALFVLVYRSTRERGRASILPGEIQHCLALGEGLANLYAWERAAEGRVTYPGNQRATIVHQV